MNNVSNKHKGTESKPVRERTVDDDWADMIAARDLDGLVNGIVYHRWFSQMPSQYSSQIDDLVATLAAGDIDLLVEKMYRQNIAMGSRLLLLARANIERSLLAIRQNTGPASIAQQEKLVAQIETWEQASSHFNGLVQKFLKTRKLLKTNTVGGATPPANGSPPASPESAGTGKQQESRDDRSPDHT